MNPTHFWTELFPLVFSVAFVAGVLGNLVASAVLGLPALAHLYRKLNRNHEDLKQHVLEVHRGGE